MALPKEISQIIDKVFASEESKKVKSHDDPDSRFHETKITCLDTVDKCEDFFRDIFIHYISINGNENAVDIFSAVTRAIRRMIDIAFSDEGFQDSARKHSMIMTIKSSLLETPEDNEERGRRRFIYTLFPPGETRDKLVSEMRRQLAEERLKQKPE